MTTNYSVIADRAKLDAFVAWLPELQPSEVYYCSLMARNKYAKDSGIGHIASDKKQCKRFTSVKERLVEKLWQLETEVGSYTVKSGLVVPQEALAAYITVNPRDTVKATRHALVRFAELVAQGSVTHIPHQEVMTAIHKSQGTKHFLDIDLDGVKWGDVKDLVSARINPEALNVLDTRGGIHLLVRLNAVAPEFVKTWWKALLGLPGSDIRGDNMIPIPGTWQGGHIPSLYTVNSDFSLKEVL